MRIPTILGLAILIIGLGAGVFLTTQNQLFSLNTKASQPLKVEKVNVVNISSTSVNIYWQTDQATPGFVQAGPTASLGSTFKDERDPQAPKPHFLHFVTLNNLNPDTTYYYKINSGSTIYPQGSPLSFKTASTLPESAVNFGQPLIGTVVNDKLQPVAEALVSLELPNNQTITTITKVAGNFILPITNSDSASNATLTVFDTEKSSKVSLLLPIKTILPPIILGQDLDLTLLTATSSAQSDSPSASPSTSEKESFSKYDLNKDGVVNSLDQSLLIKNLGPLRQSDSEASSKPKLKEADLNNDGVVNQKDIDLMSPFIPNSSPKK